MEIKISVNGKEFPVGYKLLLIIAKNIPPRPQYSKLAKGLVGIGINSISRAVIASNNVALFGYYSLPVKIMYDLYFHASKEILQALVGNDRFLLGTPDETGIPDEIIEDFAQSDDPDLLVRVASKIYQLKWVSAYSRGIIWEIKNPTRKLLLHLKNHPDQEVRKAYCKAMHTLKSKYDHDLPEEYIPTIEEAIKAGIEPHYIKLAKMRSQDIIPVVNSGRAMLREVASRLDEIEDESVRKAVCETLVRHPDPQILLDMIHGSMSESILNILAEDSEPDVAATAKNKAGKFLVNQKN